MRRRAIPWCSGDAEFVGNFAPPDKTGDAWVTVLTAHPQLPPAGRVPRPAGTRAAAGAAASPQCLPRAPHRPRLPPLALRYLDFPATQNGMATSFRLVMASARRTPRPGASPLRPQSPLRARRSRRRTEAWHRAERRERNHPRLACRRVQGHRSGHAGDRRLERAGTLPDREQLSRGGGRERDVRRGRPGDREPGRRRHHTPPQLLSRARCPGGTRSSRRQRDVSASAVAGGSLRPAFTATRCRRPAPGSEHVRALHRLDRSDGHDPAPRGAVGVRWQAVTRTTEYWVYGRTPGAQANYWVVNGTEIRRHRSGRNHRGRADDRGHRLGGEEHVRAEERPQRRRRGQHLREPLEGIAAGLRDCVHAAQFPGHLHLVRSRARALRAQCRANVAAGINILGYDTGNPSRQAADITIRQNLFRSCRRRSAATGWFMQLGDRPRDVVLEHNTIDSNGNDGD